MLFLPDDSFRCPWQDPLDVAARYAAAESMVFLYNGLPQDAVGNGLSLLVLDPESEITDDWNALEKALSTNRPCWENLWLGWIGYEFKNTLETYASNPPAPVSMPTLWFGRFRTLYLFHHPTQRMWRIGPDMAPCPALPNSNAVPAIQHLTSNMTREAYETIVAATIAEIHQGNFYQANISRKFYGTFDAAPAAPFALFAQLATLSPAAYSAYLRRGPRAILSSSPECFLTVDTNGQVVARPIKGTTPRGTSPEEDAALKQQLSHSVKDRAENLMIVDLMRNDLTRFCQPGSVQVPDLFRIHSYRTLHHMVSTITAQKKPEATVAELIQSCFPPGSMTGAPKISAVRWCDAQEAIQRGVYSGALGWLGGDGSADLSVVIRTLMIDGPRFEFQVGGGIVADSQPEAEWRETLTKARAIAELLNIPFRQLAAL